MFFGQFNSRAIPILVQIAFLSKFYKFINIKTN